ncbi:MAG: hypothetical protein AB7O56_03750 [Bauldia sp.]
MRALLVAALAAITIALAGCGVRPVRDCIDHPVICAGAVGAGATAAIILL